ncbi:MAG TPA: hypothetical protein VKV30_11235 [Candidatus Angelobacter sp.]|nr:hypothetical protein [Candidatus Angelobacter sp.]
MLKTANQRWLCGFLFWVVAASSGVTQDASSLSSTATEFVQLIQSRVGSPSTVAVTFQNLSSFSPEKQEALQNAIFNAFRNANVRVVKPEQAVAEMHITFSEDWQGYLLIASIQQGSSSQTVLKKLPRQQQAQAAHATTLTIRKISVWQQETPVLDFYQDNQNLLVLEPSQVALYSMDSGQWRQRQTLGIPHQNPWPRDLRGRLEVRGGEINVFLPGVRCSGKISPPSLDCRGSDDPWPIGEGLVAFFSPRRNFFNGLLAGSSAGASVAPFFSGATWQSGDQHVWLFTGTDGHTRLFQNDLGTATATFNGWGSTLAPVHSVCGSGWQVLTSSPADTTRPDSVQAVEISGREALPVSAPVDLAGTVEALWTAGNYGQVVNGVLHSQQGKYEAFTLTVICNQ